MVFGLFRRKDPICGMREEKGKGIEKHGKWFCSNNCVNKFKEIIKDTKESKKETSKGGCCCH